MKHVKPREAFVLAFLPGFRPRSCPGLVVCLGAGGWQPGLQPRVQGPKVSVGTFPSGFSFYSQLLGFSFLSVSSAVFKHSF